MLSVVDSNLKSNAQDALNDSSAATAGFRMRALQRTAVPLHMLKRARHKCSGDAGTKAQAMQTNYWTVARLIGAAHGVAVVFRAELPRAREPRAAQPPQRLCKNLPPGALQRVRQLPLVLRHRVAFLSQ